MPSTYTLNNGIELIATGEQSGTWGDTTNTNMSLLDTALDGQVTVTLASAGNSGSPNTLPISDGAASDGRNRMVIFNDGVDLGATAYVQLTPNDAEKIVYIRNALSGSRSIIVFQGTYNASNDYEIPAGTTAVVYFNGGGTGAVAANVFNNAYFDSLRLGGVSVTAILDEDDMSSDSATSLATQQSIKAYVDSQVGAVDTLAEILANGNTTGGTDISVSSGDDITFADSSKAIFGAGSDLQIYHDASDSIINDNGTGSLKLQQGGSTKLEVTSTGIDVTGTVTADGLQIDGAATITQSAGSDFLKFDVDGTTDEAILGIDSTDFIIDIDPTDVRASSNFVVKNDGVTNLTLNSSGDLDVNGTVTADGLTVDGTVDGTAVALLRADNNSVTKKNTLRFEDTDTTTQNDQQIGRIEFYSNDTDHTGVDAVIEAVSATNGLKELRFLTSDTANTPLSRLAIDKSGNISFYDTDGTTASFVYDASAGLTINEAAADRDFRVESVNKQYMLFVDAGNDRVGINENAPTAALHVNSGANGNIIQANGSATAWDFILKGTNDGAADSILYEMGMYRDDGSTNPNTVLKFGRGGGVQNGFFVIDQNGTEALRLSNTGFEFNDDSNNLDFRVESNSNTHALFVDAGNDRVTIGDSSGGYDLNVRKTVAGGDVGFQISNRDTTQTAGTRVVLEFQADVDNDGTLEEFLHIRGGTNTSGFAEFVSRQGTSIRFQGDAGTSVVFNDSGVDQDFRVESSSNSHMFFVDAANDHIGINTNTPENTIDIFTTEVIRFANDDVLGNVLLYNLSNNGLDNASASIRYQVSDNNSSNNARGQVGVYQPTVSSHESHFFVNLRKSNGNETNVIDVSSEGDFVFRDNGTGNGAGPDLELYRDSESPANNDLGPRILFDGENSADAKHTYYSIYSQFTDVTDGGEDATVHHQISNAGTLRSVLSLKGASEVSINEESQNIDFRVESDSETHALFVDAGLSRVGIKEDSPQSSLHITETNSTTFDATSVDGQDQWGATVAIQNLSDTNDTFSQILFRNRNTSKAVSRIASITDSTGTDMAFVVETGGAPYEVLRIAREGDMKLQGSATPSFNFLPTGSVGNADISFNGTDFIIVANSSSADLKLKTNSTERVRFTATSEVAFNEDSNNYDFRVESDSNTHALFVNAGNGRVGVNTNAAAANFHVQSSGADTSNPIGLFSNVDGGPDDAPVLKISRLNNQTTPTNPLYAGILIEEHSANYALGVTDHLGNLTSSIGSLGGVVFNESSNDVDFRVESVSNNFMLFVDASAEAVIIGNNAKRTTGGFDPALTIDDAKNSAFFRNNSGGAIQGMQSGGTTGTQNFLLFYNQGGTNIGSVSVSNGNTGTTVSYNTSSDARLKENIADAEDAGALIDAIQVRQFDWIEDGEHQRYGMVAQELNTVVPEAVSEGQTEEDMMGVDYSKLVPMLVKEIQSLRARVAQLESN